jgi:hypothetical protein
MLATTTALIAVAALASPAFAQTCTLQDGSCVISTNGADGHDGPDGTITEKNGSWGTEGSAATDIVTTIENMGGLVSSGVAYSPINITAFGGNGGQGGNAYADITENNFGGNGADGMDGGAINATITTSNGYATPGTTGLPISGVTIASLGGAAGGGGVASSPEGSIGNGTSGTGGDGQNVVATVGGNWQSTTGDGLYVASIGGAGGTGRSTGFGLADGANGGQGGNAGSVQVTATGIFIGAAAGVEVISAGGDGGDGGNGGNGESDDGGDGGNAGNGGNATGTLATGAQVLMQQTPGPGFVVGSFGGAGGAGGAATGAGDAGAGGNAGNAAAIINGQVTMSGPGQGYGVLVQSIGGVGGNGGRSGAWFNPQSGNGNQGGTAGTATITGTGASIQTGTDQGVGFQTAVLAQSIGGGGGVGPSSKDGWVAIGGDGGNASPGNTAGASLTNSTVNTFDFASSGIVAQSIGGGGGVGGDATSSVGLIVNMVVGGNGGQGGNAADASAANLGAGTITTLGDQSSGVVMQSIGGGGGSGGAGYGTTVSGFFGASVAVGGAAGSGGTGGTVNAAQADNNSGNILTSGAQSFGILAQSIGGGGGSGGASTAKSYVFSGGNAPGLSLTLSTGGSGGGGGSASTVFMQNSGFVATTGNGAAGMVGQAIGGGGGTAGDADGAASASGGSFDFSADISHGGNGGGAGDGGVVTGVNDGLIITRGESADGMLIQSIGGGGGSGGAGDALAKAGGKVGLSMSLAIGGQSAGGGEGYDVFATNNGAILTVGDGAYGIVMQTIGGGGGRGGGAAASNSGKIGLGVAIGASGGSGGDTFYNGSNSGVTNTGTILTYGADAGGILAQSIGGGGGAGGTAGTTLGTSVSNDDGSNGSNESVGKTIAAVAGDDKNVYNNIAWLATTAASMLGQPISDGDIVQNLDQTAAAAGSVQLGNVTTNNTLVVAVGGKGGAGGAGGDISVTSTGTVATMGNMSDAIVSQSIGGGGGKGGAATTAGTNSWSSPGITSGVAVGGGTQGASNNPNATSSAQAFINNTGSIIATGAISGGLIAQSIGMGGGIGGSTSITTTDSEGNQVLGFPVAVGGTSEAKNGIGQAAVVKSSGAIQTLGHDSYGIIAQSISGGGGIVKTLAANLDYAGGSAVTSSAKSFFADISLGSDHGVISGISGAALVTTTQGGTITTSGDNSFGILAQSVAGGGGLALGGTPTGTTALDLFGSGGKTGSVNPGLSNNPDVNSGVVVEVGDDITTSGNGSVGVFAQSVGGGGGISGNIGASTSYGQATANHSSFVGNGGDVQVTVDAGATITTTGTAAAGIIAQSVGGGGGWVGTEKGAYVGSAGGSGEGYPVIVSVNGSVDAQGGYSPGIFVQSTGGADNGGEGTGSQLSVTVGSATNSTASVWGGNVGFDQAAAVYFANGGTVDFPNQLINYGNIATHDTVAGTAIFGDGKYFQGTNYGTITGNIHLATGDITNEDGGTIHTYSDVDLGGGQLLNRGTLDLTGEADETTLSGNYLGEAGSRIAVGADFVSGKSDRLTVSRDATVNSGIAVLASTLVPGTLTVLTAAGALDATGVSDATGSHIFDFTPGISGNAVSITSSAEFLTDGLTREESGLATHLQRIWDGEDPGALAHGFAALSTIADQPTYAAALDSLISRQVAAIATARFDASRAFVANMNSCPVFLGDGLVLEETNCAWARLIGGEVDRNASESSVGFTASTTTLQLGGQYETWDDIFIVGSLAYETGSVDGASASSSADGNVFLGGVGLKYQSGPLLASAIVDFGRGDFDSTRLISIGGETFAAYGSPTASNVGVHGRLSYEFPFERFYLRPSLDLNASYIRMDGYDESGAGDFDLSVDGVDGWSYAATPMMEIGTRIDLDNGATLRPFLGVGATFTSGTDWVETSRFSSAPASAGDFTSRIENPDLLGVVKAGIEVMASRNFDATLQYNGAFGSDLSANSGAFKLTWRF